MSAHIVIYPDDAPAAVEIEHPDRGDPVGVLTASWGSDGALVLEVDNLDVKHLRVSIGNWIVFNTDPADLVDTSEYEVAP